VPPSRRRAPPLVLSLTDTIYFVDDDAALRRAMPRLLGGLGYDVRAFASAEAFLDGYAAGSGGCLLLDMRMPGASGMELLELLRRRGDAVPIVFLTSHDEPWTRTRALAAGASDFLTKPVSEETLVTALERALHPIEIAAARSIERAAPPPARGPGNA
jgi:two-component system, LuxR family, response regulator FixJ